MPKPVIVTTLAMLAQAETVWPEMIQPGATKIGPCPGVIVTGIVAPEVAAPHRRFSVADDAPEIEACNHSSSMDVPEGPTWIAVAPAVVVPATVIGCPLVLGERKIFV